MKEVIEEIVMMAGNGRTHEEGSGNSGQSTRQLEACTLISEDGGGDRVEVDADEANKIYRIIADDLLEA